MSYINQALHFLITLFFDLVSLIFLLRLVLEREAAMLYVNPLFQLLCRLTGFALRLTAGLPLPRLWRTVAVLFVVVLCMQIIKVIVTSTIGPGIGAVLPGTGPGIVVLGMALVIQLVLQIYLVCLFLFVILSWLQSGVSPALSPITQVLVCLLRPILSPLRRLLPPLAGLDLSPMAAFVLIYLGQILLYMPLRDLAYAV